MSRVPSISVSVRKTSTYMVQDAHVTVTLCGDTKHELGLLDYNERLELAQQLVAAALSVAPVGTENLDQVEKLLSDAGALLTRAKQE